MLAMHSDSKCTVGMGTKKLEKSDFQNSFLQLRLHFVGVWMLMVTLGSIGGPKHTVLL